MVQPPGRGLAGPQRLSEVLSFRFLWRRWQRRHPGCARVSLSRGVTHVVCPVCVWAHTHSCARVDLWLRACVCALVPITAQRTACPGPAPCGFSRGRQVQAVEGVREEAQ